MVRELINDMICHQGYYFGRTKGGKLGAVVGQMKRDIVIGEYGRVKFPFLRKLRRRGHWTLRFATIKRRKLIQYFKCL